MPQAQALLQRPRHPAVVAFDALAFDVEKAQIHKPAGFHFHVASARLVAAVAEEGAVEGAVESERSLPPVATGAAPQPQPHHVTLHNIIKKVTQFFKPREEKQDPTLLFVNTLLQELTSRGGSSTIVGQSFQSLWKFFSAFWKKLHDTFGLPEVFDEFDADQLAKFREAISICLKQIWDGIQDLEQFIEYILKGSSLLFTIFEIFGTIKQNPELEANLLLDYAANILDKVFAMLAGLLKYPKVIANPSEKVPVEVPVDRYALAELIKKAAAENKVVRVLGSGHSFPNAIRVAAAGARPAVNVVLDSADFRGYEVVEKYPDGSARVRVGAGMHLGTDHSVPLKPDVPIRITSKKGYIATINNQQVGTLNVKLFKDDLAMIDLGGIDHQTVGGFLSTGSNGASGFDTNRNLEDHILGFTIIDGKGEFHKITKDDPLFAAVGCSMGLLGVIIEVELKAVPIFGLQGTQTNGFIADAKTINFDLFGDFPGQGYETLDEFMHKEDYGRILWWPQKGVEKVTLWKGKAISAEDVKNHTIQEYVEVGNVTTAYSGRRAMQKLAGTIFGLADEIPYLTDLSKQAGLPSTIAAKIEDKLYGTYADLLNSLFITDGTLNFRDYSFKLIPMDNYVDDILMKTEFTELWVEANDAQFLVNKLRDYYIKNGWSAAGNYSLEIYSGGKSPFWMSPAYGRDVVRFDWFWYGGNQGDPVTTGFFPQFWEFFKDELQKAGKQPFRLHWGKWLPDPFSYDASTGPKTTSWIQYLTYGREKEFAEFKALREKLDPNDVFLNDYWSFHLDIQPKGREALIPQPKLQFNTRTLQQRVCASAGIPERDLRIATPDSLPALQKIVQEAFEKKEILKPVGTQYCYNEAAFVPVNGQLVDVNKFLHSVYVYSDLNPETSLKEVDPYGILSDATLESVKKRNVIRVEAGATIQMINERLWPKTARKAGISEGYKTVKVHQCYDQLSVAGSVAVGAHGPGLRAPISDSVLSILLVTVDSQGVKNVIIERTQGVTDKQRFEAQKQNFPGRVYLEQNDDVFYTALLSLGGTGIFYSFLLEVEDAHFVLRQSTFLELSNPRDVAALEAAIARAEKPDSFGIMMVANPYTKKEAVLMEYQAIPGNLNDEQKKLMDAPLGLPRTVPNWGIEILIDLIVTSARTNAKELVPLFLRLFLQLLTWPPATSKVVQDVPTALGLGSLESANANVTEVLAPYKKPSDVTDGLKHLFATAEKLAEETNQPGEPGFLVMPAMLTGVVLLELVGSSKAKLAQTYGSEKNYAIEMFGMNGYPTSYTALKEITERSIAANPSYRPHWGEELFDLVQTGKAQALFPGYNDFRTIFNAHFSEALPVFGNEFMTQLLNPPTTN